MDRKIIIQKCNFNNIYFLLFFLSAIFFEIIQLDYYLKDWESDSENYKKYILPYQILILYISNISDFIVIIPLFMKNKILDKKNSIENKNVNDEPNKTNEITELIYNNTDEIESKKRKKTVILFSFLVSLFNFLTEFMPILFYMIFINSDYDTYDFSFEVPFQIISQYIADYLILKIYFFKLQYFSLFLTLIIFIIILIIDIINIFLYNSFDSKIFLFYPFQLIFYSLEYSFGKKVMLNGYISIYTLFVIKGIIKLIFTILFSTILIIKDINILAQLDFFFSETKYIFLIIGNIIIEFLRNLFFWIIIDRFNPNYTPLAIILEGISCLIAEFIHGNKYTSIRWDEPFRIFLHIILFIVVLIHNEIIIINICGLASETKYFLDLKVKNEEQFSDSNNIDVIKRYETINEMDSISDGQEEVANI